MPRTLVLDPSLYIYQKLYHMHLRSEWLRRVLLQAKKSPRRGPKVVSYTERIAVAWQSFVCWCYSHQESHRIIQQRLFGGTVRIIFPFLKENKYMHNVFAVRSCRYVNIYCTWTQNHETYLGFKQILHIEYIKDKSKYWNTDRPWH